MRHTAAIPLCAAALLAATVPASAIQNGTPDGNSHPTIGYIIGTDSDPNNCSGSHQFFTAACTATLIDNDVVITTGSCVNSFQGGLDDGIVDELWLILAENPFIGGSFDCTQFRDVDETQLHADTGTILGVCCWRLQFST